MVSEIFEERPFKRSPITQTIVDRLRQLGEGETVSFAELSELVHQKISASSPYWQSAKHICLRDYEMIVERLSTDAAIRLKNGEISKHATGHHLKKLKSSSKKLRNHNETVDASRLDQEGMARYCTAKLYADMTDAMVAKSTQKKIEKRSSQLNPGEEIDKQSFLEDMATLWQRAKSRKPAS